jgi:hypothetical protein
MSTELQQRQNRLTVITRGTRRATIHRVVVPGGAPLGQDAAPLFNRRPDVQRQD